MCFGLAVTRIMSGHFSVHDYGTYSQITLLSSTIGLVTIMGMMDGVNYFFSRETDPTKRDTYVSTIFFMQSVVGTVCVLIMVACAIPIAMYFDNSDVESLVIYAALIPVLQNFINMMQVMFMVIGKAKLIAVRNLTVSFMKLIAILIACYAFDNIAVVLICQTLLELIQVIYFAFVLKKNDCYINPFKFDKALFGEILGYCLPMGMFTITMALNKDCDKFVIAALTDTETFAVFSNAAKHLPFDIIMTSFCTVLVPYITRYLAGDDYDRTRNVYSAFLELSYISTGILAIGAVCIAPELMELLYTEKYISGVNIFVVYIIAEIFKLFNITTVLCAAGKTKIVMYIGGGALAMNLVLNIGFYYWMGIIGPAVATLVVTVIEGIVMLSMSARVMHTSLCKMFDLKYACTFIIQLAVAGFVVNAIRLGLLNLGWHGLIVMCACCSVFMGGLGLVNLRRLKQNMSIINSCKIG